MLGDFTGQSTYVIILVIQGFLKDQKVNSKVKIYKKIEDERSLINVKTSILRSSKSKCNTYFSCKKR